MVTVTRATSNDLGAVVAMFREFAFGEAGCYRFAEWCPDHVLELFGELIVRPGGLLLVAKDDAGEYVGACGAVAAPVYFDPGKTLAQELFWWVKPGRRGSGIGKAMLAELEAWAKSVGAVRVVMVALDAVNHDQVADHYKASGYRRLETSFAKEVQ